LTALFFITHPEVVIDPAVPVPDWPLSAIGRRRMERFCESTAARRLAAVVSSAERKARDGADILAERLSIPATVEPDLGENDRSATGYLAPPEFWDVVDAFFAQPDRSIRGWERAVDAQSRVVRAVERVARLPVEGDLAVVSHGGVGALLMAHLSDAPISRRFDQPHGGGGCCCVIDRDSLRVQEGWRVLEDVGPKA
jgi:broad specificity phosphatase PhoE